MRKLTLILWLITLLITPSVMAQEDDDIEPENLIVYGEVISGRINNTTPSVIYHFEGLRGDYLAVRFRATGGDLDPILMILDPDNNIIRMRDDSNGSFDAVADGILIEERGIYTVVVARFGYGVGTTSGSYELSVELIGNSSESGSTMRYGNTVSNTISNEQYELYYTFIASQGDIVNVTMRQRSGDLDPYLRVVQIVNGQAIVLDSSDDVPGLGLDAQIEGLVIPVDGTYVVIASRYGVDTGISAGNFTLTIDEAANSGLGNSAQAAIPIGIGARIEGQLNNDQWARYYRFEARQDDVITISMARPNCQGGCLDTFVSIANAGLVVLAENDDIEDGDQNSLIEDFIIPATGTYYIIATRYLQDEGTSTGTYVLEIEDGGNLFDDVPEGVLRLTYGFSTTGTLDAVTSEVVYAFFGREGDVITISMNRSNGDLDPFLYLLNSDLVILQSNDDNGIDQNALINSYTLPSTGVFYIRATRFSSDPPTTGSFNLVLAQRVDGS